jgi:hypothetical protein
VQFPSGDFGGDTGAQLTDLHTPPLNIEPEVPAPYVGSACTDPPVNDTDPLPTLQVDAHPPPVILQQVIARDLLLGMEALGRRMDELQVSNNMAQMGKRVSALEQHWERKFTLLEAKVSNLEIKTLNNSMISGNLAGLVNSVRPPNNPNLSFAPPPIAGSSTSPYGALPPSWCPGNVSTPATVYEPSVSHAGRRYTHAWDESHASPETSDPAGPSDLPGAASASGSGKK